MTRVTVTRDLACSVDAFWELFLDTSFMKRLFEELGFTAYEVLELRKEPTAVVRKSRAEPPLEAPGVVQRLLGPSFGYEEDGRFDERTRTWTWTATPSVLADRSQIGGVLHVEELGSDRCRMNVEARVDVRMLGVGGLLEATGERTMRSAWTKTADYFEKSVLGSASAGRRETREKF